MAAFAMHELQMVRRALFLLVTNTIFAEKMFEFTRMDA